MNGVSTREEIGIVPKESQINRLSAISIRTKMILKKRSKEKLPGWKPKTTTTRKDGKKAEITLVPEPGTVLQWSNQSNVLKRAKTAIAMEALFSSLRPLLLVTRKMYQTLVLLLVKL